MAKWFDRSSGGNIATDLIKSDDATQQEIKIINAQRDADVAIIQAQSTADLEQAHICTTRNWLTGKTRVETVHHNKAQAKNGFDVGSGNSSGETYLDGYGYSDVR